MANKTSSKSKKPVFIAFVAAIAVAVIIGFFVSQSQRSIPNEPSTETPIEGSVRIKGVMLCLPHKDTSGPQTEECAFGLKDEKANYYGLKDSDPGYKNISSMPMNERVEVSGIFKKETGSRYPTIGTIEVTKITRN